MKVKKLLALTVVLVLWNLECSLFSEECSPELLDKKIVVILGSGSIEATAEVLRDIGTILENQFLNRGFRVIDQATLDKIIPEQEKKLVLAGDTVGAIKLGEKLGVDLILSGQVSVNVKALEGFQTNLKSVHVTLTLKFLDAKTAQAISSKTWSWKSAGSNVSGVVINIVQKNSETAVSSVYNDYCLRSPSSMVKTTEESPSEAMKKETEDTKENQKISPQPSSSLDKL